MNAKEIKAELKEKFTDCSIVIEQAEYTYLHDYSSSFETRTLPALKVRVTGKKVVDYTFRGHPLYNQPATTSIVDFARSIGLCAEYCYAGNWQMYIIDAPKEQWPINTSTGLGSWQK